MVVYIFCGGARSSNWQSGASAVRCQCILVQQGKLCALARCTKLLEPTLCTYLDVHDVRAFSIPPMSEKRTLKTFGEDCWHRAAASQPKPVYSNRTIVIMSIN